MWGGGLNVQTFLINKRINNQNFLREGITLYEACTNFKCLEFLVALKRERGWGGGGIEFPNHFSYKKKSKKVNLFWEDEFTLRQNSYKPSLNLQEASL